jgi:hypothetical protein
MIFCSVISLDIKDIIHLKMKSSFMMDDILAPEPPMKKKRQYIVTHWIDKVQNGEGQAKKGNRNRYNKVLDEKLFNGEHHDCLSAGQVATGQFIGMFLLLRS